MPAILHTLDGRRRRAHRRKHGCNRSRRPSAPTLPRQSLNRGAPRTVHPTGDCETTVAANDAMYAVPSRLSMVRGLCPRDCIRGVVGARQAHRGKRGQNRSRSTSASKAARRSHNHGASWTPPLTGGSETNVAAYDVTGAGNHTHTARLPHGSAETYPIATTVGGGVLDAPRLRDCRGGLVADGRRGRLQPRLTRRTWWHPPPNVSNPAGTARAPFVRARRLVGV